MDYIEIIINGIKAWVNAELAKLRHLVTSTRSIAEKAQSAVNAKADADNPVFTGAFSQNRRSRSTVGDSSHAEGFNTEASGDSSHAEGFSTTASSRYSHAEGYNTLASGDGSHVQGAYNVEDTSNVYAHIVGNGKRSSKRSNAHTLDWNGVAWFQGRPQFGGTAQDDGSQTVMANGDKEIILTSSTTDSTKKFKITVDDTGTLTTTEITE